MHKKRKNAGFTLVEMVVSLAVSSIIILALLALVASGVSSYRKETTNAQLQNEAEISLNHITDNMMEAYEDGTDYLSLLNNADGSITDSFSFNPNQKYVFKDKDANGIGKLYMETTTVDPLGNTVTDSALLCENVKSFNVKLLSTCIDYEKEDASTKYNIKEISARGAEFVVSITLANGEISRSTSRTVSVRNPISNIIIENNGLLVGSNLNYMESSATVTIKDRYISGLGTLN